MEKINNRELGKKEIYNDGRPFFTEYNPELAIRQVVEKINEMIDVIESIKEK